MTDKCIAGVLSITQAIGMDSIELSRDYDFAIAAVSWEKRAAAAFHVSRNLPKDILLFRFQSADKAVDASKDVSEIELKSLFAAHEVHMLLSSTRFMENAEKIEQVLRDKYQAAGRPVRILLDITCIPKSYLLFIIGLGFCRDYISRLDCLYAEGEYNFDDVFKSSGDGDICFVSEGEWGALQVPYLGAESSIPNHRDLLVSMGGEIGLSLPFIDRYEPRRLGMVLIKDGALQTANKIPESEVAALDRILSEGNVERFDVGLADVVTMIKSVDSFCLNATSETVSGIVLGSKPHALALGVAALSNKNLELICRIPKRYRPLDVAPNGKIALYTLEDRFEPSGYFDLFPK